MYALTKKKGFRVALASAFMSVFTFCISCITSFAADATDPYSGLNEAMKTGFTSTQKSMLTTIGNILPIILVIVGAVLVVTLGIRLFKRFGK